MNTVKPVRKEIYNFKCKESQKTFRKITSNTNEFSECFEDDQPLLNQIENWRKLLHQKCKKAFKKIRITNNKRRKPINPKLSVLINIRNKMQQSGKIFASNSTSMNHKVKHRNEISFKCVECGKLFRIRQSFNFHTKKHAGVLDIQCKNCKQKYLKLDNLKDHEEDHSQNINNIEDA